MSRIPTGPLSVWATGLRIGFSIASREPLLGLKRIILPVSYWRAAEFSYVCRQFENLLGGRLLDVGSPKDLAAILAGRGSYEVISTDILEEEVEISRRYSEAQGLYGTGPGRVTARVQDGRHLDFPDNSFDAAFSVSVLEHIPDEGDSSAIRELVRVVKPGGLVVVTTPYDREYRETFVDEEVYERGYRGDPVFFERHYDPMSLTKRLLDPAGADVIDLQIWGESGIRIERLMARLGKGRALLSPVEAFLSAAFLRRLPEGTGNPMAAFLTLRKPATSPHR
jgi:SAM-dependent methyltransferase